ncbi:hypothetical protein Glove_236g19 [Diversispora epigaea]|uniref:BTB domain-containing protein n=1 Tax=Diversispora epigaea TaxID=1348612 RepID=A0A397IAK9_9GLOM|nr:hypothetical protein Glove_236g19 [Diversispora epigaea]
MAMLTPRSQFISTLNNYNNFINKILKIPNIKINNQKSTFIDNSLLFRSSNNNDIFTRGLASKSTSSKNDTVSASPEKSPVVMPKLNRVEKGDLVEKMKSYYEENYIDSFNKELLKDVKNYIQKKSKIYLNCLFYDSLSNDLTQLLEDSIDCNAEIEVGEAPLTNIYNVHSSILQSRSPYFKKKFNETTFNEFLFGSDPVKTLKLPNISVKVFDVIIKYIYGGKISLEKLENSTIFDLVIASNELELGELVEYLQIYLVNNCSSWLRLEFARIYRKSQVENLEIFKEFYNDIIVKYPNTIFESKNFHSLTEDALISILKEGELKFEESKIWDYVIEWGKAKNPTLPTNLDKWTSDDFLTLKETLKGFLPYIRYFSFSSEDVVEKIFPYHQILEPKLFLDINSKIMTPDKQISSIMLPPRNIMNTTLPNSFPSNIITNEHALTISSWIDKNETPYIENNPYEFKLIVRGSRDGFGVKTIYDICDKVSNTVIILKVKGTGEILGGYNPHEWEKNNEKRMTTEGSFVFSLKTSNMKDSILSRALKGKSVIYNYPRTPYLAFDVALCLIGNLKTEKRCYSMASSAFVKPIRSDEFVSKYASHILEVSKNAFFSAEEYEAYINPYKWEIGLKSLLKLWRFALKPLT